MADKKLTPKQEGFVLDVFKQHTLADAYRNNYNTANMAEKCIWEEASKLMSNPKVAQRLSKLQQEAAGRAQVTVASITKELEEARVLSLQEAQPSASVSASMGKAKVNGLLVEKVESKETLTIVLAEDVDEL